MQVAGLITIEIIAILGSIWVRLTSRHETLIYVCLARKREVAIIHIVPVDTGNEGDVCSRCLGKLM